MGNRKEILEHFGRQADRFERRGSSVANKDYVRWAVSFLELRPDLVALDVAGGTGLLARAAAPQLKRAIVFDLTPAMMRQGRSAAAGEGIPNVLFLQGDAEHLPFPDGSFDIVMTRFSLHHIPTPQRVVAEMKRVASRTGQVAVIDIVSPDSPSLAREQNRLEVLRDPSHVRALSRAELERLLTDAGLKLLRSGSRETEVAIDEWLGLTETPENAAREIRRALQSELQGGPPTGMRPVMHGTLMYTQAAVALIAKPT